MTLPVGLEGFLLARQQQEQASQGNLKGLAALMQMQKAPLEMELLREQVKKTRAEADQKNNVGGLLEKLFPAQQPPAAGGPSLGLDAIGKVMVVDPARGNALLNLWKAQNPDLEFVPGIGGVNKRTGAVVQSMPKISDSGRAIGAVQGPGGWQVSVPQGSADAYRQFQGIEEQERARHDLVVTPPTSPNTPPTYRSRLDLLGGQQQQPPSAPTPQQPVASPMQIQPGVQRQRDQDRLSILHNERAQQQAAGRVDPALDQEIALAERSLGARPSGTPAGMSPAQQNKVAGAKGFEETYGKEAAKSAAGLTENAQKAENQLATIDALKAALLQVREAGGGVGAFQPMVKRATEIVQGLGIDPAQLGLPKDAGPYQILDAFTNKMALGLIGVPGGMPANLFSEADRKFVQASVARPVDTEGGFSAKLFMFEAIQRRAIEQEQSWLSAQEKGTTYNKWRMEWSKHVNDNKLFNQDDIRKIIESTRPQPRSGGLTTAEQSELERLRKKYGR